MTSAHPLNALQRLGAPCFMILQLQNKLMTSDANADVGRYTYGRPTFVRFRSSERAQIGAFCSIADNVTFILGGNHFSERVTTYPLNLVFETQPLPWHESSKGRIVVGNDVWIGYGASILSGVTIGDGAVIGAGSVVTKNVEPYAIAAGNPARLIRRRFDAATIARLLALRWWDWPLADIERDATELLSSALTYVYSPSLSSRFFSASNSA